MSSYDSRKGKPRRRKGSTFLSRLFNINTKKKRADNSDAEDVKIYEGTYSNKNKKLKNTALKKKLKIVLMALLIIGIVIGIYLFAYVAKIAANLPDWNSGDIYGDMSSTFYDREGTMIAERHGMENRYPVEFDKVPDNLKNAFLATEDADFYKHFGVSFKAIFRTIITNILHHERAGASTITQQLARNALIDANERFVKSYERKITEIFLAFQLEARYDKNEIFEMYMNTVYFGNGAYGVQAASKTYFNKDVSELNLEECALLAGLVQRPNGYDPYKNSEAGLRRKSQVLSNMVEEGFISKAKAKAADSKPLELNEAPEPEKGIADHYGYFVDYAIEEAERILEEADMDSNIYKHGYKIYTTMDVATQDTMDDVYADSGNFPSDMNGEQVQSSMVVIDHETGEIYGLIGGREYTTQRGFNRACSTDMNRQPGSALKPVTVYGPALENGMSPATVFEDTPFSMQTSQGPYEPKNYDGRYRGLTSMREAVRASINVPAVRCLNEIGVPTGYDFAKKLDIPLEDNERNNLSIALGGMSYGLNPLELAAAYGAFANQGVLTDSYIVTKIETNDGTVIYENSPHQEVVMKEETAFLMTNMLQTVVSSGTGTNAKLSGWPTAGKTGTTQLPTSTDEEKRMFGNRKGNKDAWFAGYTPELTGVVWMGFDKTDGSHYLNQIYGGKYPAQIWRKVMAAAHKSKDPSNFSRPSGIVSVSIDSKSGLLPSDLTPDKYIVKEYFVKNHVPTKTSEAWTSVLVCTDTGMVATSSCPNTKNVSFLKPYSDLFPSVSEGAVKNALASKGASSISQLGASTIKNLVMKGMPEDFELYPPTEKCYLHTGTVANYPAGVNAVFWQFFPQKYRPTVSDIPKPEEPGNVDNNNGGTDNPENVDGDFFALVDIIGTESGAKIEWKIKDQYASGNYLFTIYRRIVDKEPEAIVIGETDKTSYIDNTVKPDNEYYYIITAKDLDTNNTYTSNTYKITY